MNGQGSGTVVAAYGTNTATDTFSGVGGINGGNSADHFVGGTGSDNFFGQGGNDFLEGNAGDDILEGGTGADALSGGTGFDFASYRNAGGAVTANLATLTGTAGDAAGDLFQGIEGLIGTNFNDTLTGDGFGNILIGGLGADKLDGGIGSDFESGSLIDEYANYASYINAQTGVRISLIDPASNTGEAAGDTFTNINGLIGSNFNDTLIGSYNYVNFFIGGAGDDTLIGAQNSDVVRYDTALGGVSINMSAGTVTGAAGNDTFVSIDTIYGSHFADSYDASTMGAGTPNDAWDNINRFEGFGGADTIVGNAHLDPSAAMYSTEIWYVHATAGITVDMSGTNAGTVIATYGTDTSTDTFSNVNSFSGSDFDDTFNGGDGAQRFYAGGGNDVLHGGGGNDALYGYEGDDQLYGDAGDDLFEGGAGADVLSGGDGIDTVSYAQSGSLESGAIGVTASLENPSINAGGHATGDTYVSIENLTGSYANDTLIGNSGSNVITGLAGLDTLIGNGGGDTFVFNVWPGAGNLATIVGYTHGQDHIHLDSNAFMAAGAEGALAANAFVNGAAALDANDRIIFDSATGNVMYDADGSGAGVAVIFATMQNLQGGSLNHTDFLIV